MDPRALKPRPPAILVPNERKNDAGGISEKAKQKITMTFLISSVSTAYNTCTRAVYTVHTEGPV